MGACHKSARLSLEGAGLKDVLLWLDHHVVGVAVVSDATDATTESFPNSGLYP